MGSVDITTQALARSNHRLAIRLLESATESSDENVRESAGRELIATGEIKNILAMVRKYDSHDSNIGDIFLANRERVTPALRAALMGQDTMLFRNAYGIAYSQNFFEMIPPLLLAFLNQEKHEVDNMLPNEGIYKFVDKYVQALEERKNRHRLYHIILPEILAVVFPSLKNYHRNDPELLVLTYLQLYSHINEDHGAISQLLHKPSSALHATVSRILLSSSKTAVFHFLTYCLENLNPPPIALTVFVKRMDVAFISYFLKNIAEPVSTTLIANLGRIPRFEWLKTVSILFRELDEDAQSKLVLLIQNFGLSEDDVKSRLIEVFRRGHGKSRLEALMALTPFSGEKIDQLIWDAGEDVDPNVQAEALTSLSQRDIPNTGSRILRFAGSPHEIVRQTVQKLMPNFQFQRFFEMFDTLNENQRRGMFKLVKLLDKQTVEGLSQILLLGDPKKKAKALLCIEYGELVPALEDSICSVLTNGELPILRGKAAELLAAGQRELSRSSLVQALHRDPAPEVRAAAKTSLEKRPIRRGAENNSV